jgi:hypothetical protein
MTTKNPADYQAVDSASRVESDTYDRGMIPAEVAARRDREGEGFKQLPTTTDDETRTESIRTTDGYTMDREGLLNNYAVEPEMYYEVPGDAREKIAQDIADRQEELSEVNHDKTGELTESLDIRGKGPGII